MHVKEMCTACIGPVIHSCLVSNDSRKYAMHPNPSPNPDLLQASSSLPLPVLVSPFALLSTWVAGVGNNRNHKHIHYVYSHIRSNDKCK